MLLVGNALGGPGRIGILGRLNTPVLCRAVIILSLCNRTCNSWGARDCFIELVPFALCRKFYSLTPQLSDSGRISVYGILSRSPYGFAPGVLGVVGRCIVWAMQTSSATRKFAQRLSSILGCVNRFGCALVPGIVRHLRRPCGDYSGEDSGHHRGLSSYVSIPGGQHTLSSYARIVQGRMVRT